MASLSKCVDLATRFSEEDVDELVQEMVLVREDMDVDDNVAALEAATRIVERAQTVRNAITDKTGPIVSVGMQIRETADGFEAYLDGEKVGRLKDTLARGQAALLDEPATIDIVKVDDKARGKGVGSALYKAFFDKHQGRVAPSGKTTTDAWRVWKRNYPDKVDEFVAQEQARIADGADSQIVAGNITDAEIKSRVLGTRRSPARDQTETPEFKAWFGDSKVVDAEGKPLVVYHGTDADIDGPFNIGRGDLGKGIYFASAPSDAASYASAQPGYGANVVPVFVRIENPYYWTKEDRNKSADAVNAAARRAGHDGIIRTWGESPERHFIALKPEQIKSAIGNRGTFDPSNPDIRRSPPRWQVSEPTRLDDFIRKMQDKQIDTKRVVASIKQTISGINEAFNPYLQEELYHGRAAKATKDFLDLEMRPLLQDMQARGLTIEETEKYLHNLHAEERNAQIAKVNPAMPDGGSGIDTADAKAYLAGLSASKRAALAAIAKRVEALNRKTQKMLVDSGLEKQSTIDAWNAAYKHYVPLQREEFADDALGGTGQGFSVRGAASKRAMGSSKEVSNILGNLSLARERTITRAEKNRVSTALYGLAIQAPGTDFWYAFAPERAKITPKLEAELVAMGMNPIDVQSILAEPTQQYIDPRTGLVTTRVNPLMRSAPNVVALRVNGEDRFVLFNDRNERAQRMSAALKNLDADQLGEVLGLAAKVSRWFASVNTQYNPVFGIVNGLRDVQSALFNLSTTKIAGQQAAVTMNAMSAVRGIYSDIRAHRKGNVPQSKWAQLYEEFQREGGQTGFRDMFKSSNERAEAIEDEFKKLTEGKAKAVGRAVFGWLSDYNETIENATRLAAYKVGLDQGLSKQEAASIAKNLTVNFNRKGQAALQAGALYAFFNASVQGTARLAETLRGPAGRKIALGGLLLGVLQALALSAAGFGDDEPPEFVKERSLVIPTGDGKYLSMPMPLGFHVLPSISRIATEWALNGFREPAKRLVDLLSLFADTFNPIGNAGISMQTVAPTALDPLAALLENRDYTGKPIAREDMNPLKPTPGYLRAKDTASELSKQLSYYLNLASGGTKYQPGAISPTPDQIDYLIGQVTGGVGREVLKAEQTVTSARTGEELPPNKVPLLGRFYGDTTGQASHAAKFYSGLKKVNAAVAEVDGRRENKELEGLQEYRLEHPELRLEHAAKKASKELTELKAKKRELLEKDATPERIRLVEERITLVMKRFNERMARLEDQRP